MKYSGKGHKDCLFVSWCFKPSQPQRITSGLRAINTETDTRTELKRSGQASLVFVSNIPTTWRWTRGDLAEANSQPRPLHQQVATALDVSQTSRWFVVAALSPVIHPVPGAACVWWTMTKCSTCLRRSTLDDLSRGPSNSGVGTALFPCFLSPQFSFLTKVVNVSWQHPLFLPFSRWKALVWVH